jgi:hypothetical protein
VNETNRKEAEKAADSWARSPAAITDDEESRRVLWPIRRAAFIRGFEVALKQLAKERTREIEEQAAGLLQLERAVRELRDQLAETGKHFQKRIDQIEVRLDNHDRRADRFDRRIDVLENTV